MTEILKKYKGLLFFTMLFSIISSTVNVLISLILQRIIDYATTGDLSNFTRFIIFALGYIVLIGVLYFIYSLSSKKLIKNLTRELRKKIFKGILKKNYKDFNSINSADYSSALTNDIKMVEENYIVPLLVTVENAIMFVVTLIVLIRLSPIITIYLISSMLFLFIVPSLFSKALQNKQLILSDKLSSFTIKLKDIFSGYEVIKSYNIKTNITCEFNVSNERLTNAKFQTDKLFVINESISQVLAIFTQLSVIFLSAYLVIKSNITMGTLLAIIQLSATFITPVMMVLGNLPKINSMKPVLKRIDEFINYQDTEFTGTNTPTFNSDIRITNLKFKYEDEKVVLKDISLTIEKNKKYAIVGKSGCGKSTLVKLMQGYYSNFDGDIKYDGNSIKELDIDGLNKMTSTLHQNVYMFDKDIKENICLYENFSEDELDLALKLSGVDKFLNETSKGINSFIGENGVNISGGQRQRIAIARALIRRTPIIVLDEGTSAIDMQTAFDIENNLLNMQDITLITITHNMSEELLGLYDQIVYMENGLIEEIGNLQELLRNKEKFYNFSTIDN